MSTTFTLPPGSEATATPESRGIGRDGVRLLVARPGEIRHDVFTGLAAHLEPGDLLVVNTSATVPSAVTALDGTRLHISAELPDGSWVVEPRLADNTGPDASVGLGRDLRLPGGVHLRLVAPWPARQQRLWQARVRPGTRRVDFLAQHGRPITYGYVDGPVSARDHWTEFARVPGSAEMPSASRPFTPRALRALERRGVRVAEVTLHCGVSSPELHEPPAPEPFWVPAQTARLVGSTRARGGRIVAVGTSVTRALESAARDGVVRGTQGWTDLVLGPHRPARVVDGLVTGWHAPEASHLMLLEAVAGAELVARAYDAALHTGYLWHEFGDSALLLP